MSSIVSMSYQLDRVHSRAYLPTVNPTASPMISAINAIARIPIMMILRDRFCNLKSNPPSPKRGQVRFARYVLGWTCSLSVAAAVIGAALLGAVVEGVATGLRLGIVAQLSCAFWG